MALFRELDYGTPARTGAPVTVEIDGQAISVPAGTSLMRAAQEAGIAVPKLCASDSLEPFGSCRLCLVEVEDPGNVAGRQPEACQRQRDACRPGPGPGRRRRS